MSDHGENQMAEGLRRKMSTKVQLRIEGLEWCAQKHRELMYVAPRLLNKDSEKAKPRKKP